MCSPSAEARCSVTTNRDRWHALPSNTCTSRASEWSDSWVTEHFPLPLLYYSLCRSFRLLKGSPTASQCPLTNSTPCPHLTICSSSPSGGAACPPIRPLQETGVTETLSCHRCRQRLTQLKKWLHHEASRSTELSPVPHGQSVKAVRRVQLVMINYHLNYHLTKAKVWTYFHMLLVWCMLFFLWTFQGAKIQERLT